MFCTNRRKLSIATSVTAMLMFLGSQALFADEPPATYTDAILGIELVLVKGDTFVMGDITGLDKIASPAHEVTVDGFYLGKYEVTFEQYDQFCDETAREKPSDEGWGRGNRPVINVTWDDAVAFTKWLSSKTDKSYRLPSEAEWEYAARGGTSNRYPWGNQIGSTLANCDGCGSQWDGKMTSPVGSFAPNGFGLYDMGGNVYDWCLDIQHRSYEGAPTDGSAWLIDGREDIRINRGGSWLQPPHEAEVDRRCWERSGTGQKDYGFRVLMEK